MNLAQKITTTGAVIVMGTLAGPPVFKICNQQKIKNPEALCICAQHAGFYGIFKLPTRRTT